jgi:DNA-binding protein HU-beta
MNKTELINEVARTANLTKKDAEKAFNAVVDVITAELAAGNKVQVIGFGTFEVHERKARVGQNPRTKKKIEIPASKAAAFKSSKKLKEAVNG